VIGLDTNVLVRYVVRDDPTQTARADAVLDRLGGEELGFVSLLVLAELHWTLLRAYGYAPADATAVIALLLATAELVVQGADLVRRALDDAVEGADFADAVIAELGAAAACTTTMTFDRGAARLPGMTLL
jgi:predicted nucleic-acid-binding protein